MSELNIGLPQYMLQWPITAEKSRKESEYSIQYRSARPSERIDMQILSFANFLAVQNHCKCIAVTLNSLTDNKMELWIHSGIFWMALLGSRNHQLESCCMDLYWRYVLDLFKGTLYCFAICSTSILPFREEQANQQCICHWWFHPLVVRWCNRYSIPVLSKTTPNIPE